MEKLLVETPGSTYPVFIGEGIRNNCAELLQPLLSKKSKALIITDSHVNTLYGEDLETNLNSMLPTTLFTIPEGEQSKSIEAYENGLTACIEANLDRKSVIIALGGGVVGDIAGFIAATYMRGISFVQVPTTLLAQDSSVGGKTGINHRLGKNLIGAFHQPEAVVYDTLTLATLSDKEWRSGFAEMIKHAYIKDPEFLSWLKDNVTCMEDMKKNGLLQFLKRSIAIKADIVKEDEKEAGIRAYLNFGHTLGHALEKVSGYGHITHGEGVAAGMIFAMRLSNHLELAHWDIDIEKRWLENLGYPVHAASMQSPEALISAMKTDKKTTAGKLTFVLAEKPGFPFLQTVDESDVLFLLKAEKKERDFL
ncbi:3-dehydroquinate synthase [Salibacterium salarium]|uniref:3-dehydroquinate synthase n=1 Tax=Salibacterium salarium TaxID=284579 RepID=A0A3R9Q4I7_9BACI|nr:3-dehydroquinate synthase [Salibacterium salarium]RSL33461.1 3-dehydroquinate synthase [Salibacterium salarium]